MPPENVQRQSNSSLSKFAKRIDKKIFFGTLLVIIFIIGVVGGSYLYIFNKNGLVVGDIKITKKQYTQLTTEAKTSGVAELSTDDQINNYIIETLKLRLAAQKFNFSTNQADIDEMAKSYFSLPEQNNPNNWQKIVAENMVYQINIGHIQNGDKLMARLVFPFSRFFVFNPESSPEGYGDLEKIKSDQAYANEQLKIARDQLAKDGSEQNVQKIINNIKNDNRLDYGFTGKRSSIFYFNKDTGKMYYSPTNTQNIGDEKLQKLLSNLNSGISDTQTEDTYKGFSRVSGYGAAGVPYAYYFYANINSPGAQPSINNEINEYTKDIKVKNNE